MGVTAGEATLAGPSPTAFVAKTRKLYATQFVRFVTVADVPTTSKIAEGAGGETRTVYPVSSRPPSVTGAFQLRVTEALPAAAVTFVGVAGTSGILIAAEGAEGAPAPTVFMAVTVNV